VIGVLLDLLDPHQQGVQQVKLVEPEHDLLVISDDAKRLQLVIVLQEGHAFLP
jgi:hypothetical protein